MPSHAYIVRMSRDEGYLPRTLVLQFRTKKLRKMGYSNNRKQRRKTEVK